MDPEKRWLDAVWPFVRASMPAPPGRVLEIGCGPLGGFVPALRADGYAATGVDPRAPEEPGYHRLAFEEHRPTEPVEAIVACRALHHAADLDVLLDAVRDALVPGGTVVVVEWARERFDEPTARWCFARLSPPPVDTEPGWLHRHRDRWLSSGLLLRFRALLLLRPGRRHLGGRTGRHRGRRGPGDRRPVRGPCYMSHSRACGARYAPPHTTPLGTTVS